jgi:hypothetical protein
MKKSRSWSAKELALGYQRLPLSKAGRLKANGIKLREKAVTSTRFPFQAGRLKPGLKTKGFKF